ncbi:prefoldin subunit alpha [Thermoproteota archaeon]
MSDAENQLQTYLQEFKMLESRLNEITTQREMLIRTLMEIRGGLSTLKGLNKLASSEVLIPIGGGVFVNAKTPPSDKFLVGIGANVIIEKNKEDSIKYVENRVNEIENAVKGTDAHRMDINNNLMLLRETINEIMAKQQG